jgi:26S proteasome regulatory subunit N13
LVSGVLKADPTPGRVMVTKDGETIHFRWINATSGVILDDLIVFADGDTSWRRVPQAKDGRIFMLKISSSKLKYFYWLQDPSTEHDGEITDSMNALLGSGVTAAAPPPSKAGEVASTLTNVPSAAASEASSAPAASAVPSAPASTSGADAFARFMSQLQYLQNSKGQSVTLSSVLTPDCLRELLAANPAALAELLEQLPSNVNTEAELFAVLSSPMMREAMSTFDHAASVAYPDLLASFGITPDNTSPLQGSTLAFLLALLAAVQRNQATKNESNP